MATNYFNITGVRDAAGEGNTEGDVPGNNSQSERGPINLEPTGHSHLVKNYIIHEYVCNIRASKYAVGGSFNCHIFLGDQNNDEIRNACNSNRVGTFSIYGNLPTTTGCAKHSKEDEDRFTVTGSIPLTGVLLGRITELKSLEPEIVVPYLKNNLHWMCSRPDNTPIPIEEIPSLKVGVASVLVQIPTADHLLPTYGQWQRLYEVTAGRIGGLAKGDNL
ncbi:hypothetical protein HOY80DRAFT_917226 [Tuber brumale]|nr:hypothetical protein HOY80DRAFT_917226 [Tuber brumale]